MSSPSPFIGFHFSRNITAEHSPPHYVRIQRQQLGEKKTSDGRMTSIIPPQIGPYFSLPSVALALIDFC